MANRKIWLSVLLLCTSIYLVGGRGGGHGGHSSHSSGGHSSHSSGGHSSHSSGSHSSHSSGGHSSYSSGGHSSSSGGSSWGKGWGGSSSNSGSSWSKPSSSYGSSGSSSWGSGSSGSSWGSSYNKPSTSWNTGSSSGSGSSWSNPSYGSGSHSYPSSSSGLSGSGSHGYPSSGSGLSGNNYNPSSSSGSGSHSYPWSGTGLSGGGYKYPSSSGSGSHSYPSGSGLSGSGSKYPSSSSGTHYNPSRNTYNTNSGYYGGSRPSEYIPHTYYTDPQHVYVTQYRDSGSRYSDLLTGLTLYNMGRSHSHYHNHYYHDDSHRYYPTGNYGSSSGKGSSYDTPDEQATCSLRIKEDGKLDVLKIPCEIVSTFTEGSKKVEKDSYANYTECKTSTTVTRVIPSTASQATTSTSTTTSTTKKSYLGIDEDILGLNAEMKRISDMRKEIDDIFHNYDNDTPRPIINFMAIMDTTTETPTTTTTTTLPPPTMATPIISTRNRTDGNVFTSTVTNQTATDITVNVTTCTTYPYYYTDPLSVKDGPHVDPSKMECAVDIKTKYTHFRNTVECKTLMEYSKMPEPSKEKPLLPPRQKLKTWLEKPPWWLSLFIAV